MVKIIERLSPSQMERLAYWRDSARTAQRQLKEYAKLRPDAERWRRAVRSCLADPDANGDPVAAVECVSHLALHDAEAEIARLREALEYCVCQTECLHGLAHITSKARAALRGGEDA